jgi:hypothetical protein
LYGFPLALLLGGCATYNPNTHYDPDAVEKVGFITAKSLVLEKHKSKPRGSFIPVPVNGTITMVYSPDASAGGGRYREVYRYVVAVSAHESVSVLDTYPAFQVGDCAKVFLSSRPTYPRIAPGSGCTMADQAAAVPPLTLNEGGKLQARVQAAPHLATRSVATQSASEAKSGAVHGIVGKIPLTIGFANLSEEDVSGIISEDRRALSGLFSRAAVAPKGVIPRAQVLMVYGKFTADGTVSGSPAFEMRRLVQESGANLIIFAMPNSAETVKHFAHSAELKSATVIYTLDRNEEGFSRYFRELFLKMGEGKPLLNAWVELAPQHPQAMPAYVPQTIVMAGAGNVVFPRPARAEARLAMEVREVMKSAIAQCDAAPRCIKVGEGSTPHAHTYLEQVIKKISSIGRVYLAVAGMRDSGVQAVTTRVMLASDGNLRAVNTISSGAPALTGRIERLFRVAAPYAPFNDHLREQADTIVADITFHFEDANLVSVTAGPPT